MKKENLAWEKNSIAGKKASNQENRFTQGKKEEGKHSSKNDREKGSCHMKRGKKFELEKGEQRKERALSL